jgi:hypothetical protein
LVKRHRLAGNLFQAREDVGRRIAQIVQNHGIKA